MKTKVRVEAQVEEFVKSLAPDPRRRLRLAIRGLEDGEGDTKALEGNLTDYCRLSITGYRVIYRERTDESCPRPPRELPAVQVPKEEYLGDGTSGEGRFPIPAIFPKY